jgi:hypothetical protein
VGFPQAALTRGHQFIASSFRDSNNVTKSS